jgi:hypothetical protein
MPAAVLARFLGALRVPEDERRGDVDALAARFRSAVAHLRLLVVLDDARDADQVRPLLPGGSGCRVLVTSRRLLAELPGSVLHPLGGLDEPDALAILAEAAGGGRIAADPAGAAHIVQLCAGLPLAVRIAGSRLRARPTWTPTDLADRLADERRRLDELRLGDAAVRSTFDTSYRELSTMDRLVFQRAGPHPGPAFGIPAAAALAADEPADRDTCLVRLLDWLTAYARPGDRLVQERDNVLAAVHRAVDAGASARPARCRPPRRGSRSGEMPRPRPPPPGTTRAEPVPYRSGQRSAPCATPSGNRGWPSRSWNGPPHCCPPTSTTGTPGSSAASASRTSS